MLASQFSACFADQIFDVVLGVTARRSPARILVTLYQTPADGRCPIRPEGFAKQFTHGAAFGAGELLSLLRQIDGEADRYCVRVASTLAHPLLTCLTNYGAEVSHRLGTPLNFNHSLEKWT